MKKKIIFQITLLLSVFLITLTIYLKYFHQKTSQFTKKNSNKKIILDTRNIINDITYKSSDDYGRNYIINSKKGNIDYKNSEFIFMEEVKAEIILTNKEKILIESKKAKYNHLNFNTEFKENVILNYLDHQVKSDNLNLFINDNIIEVFNNLVYKNSSVTLIADKLEIDLISKDTKIFNYDGSNVNLSGINK